MGVWSACMCLYNMHAWYIPMTKEGTGSLRTASTDGYEQPCGARNQPRFSTRTASSAIFPPLEPLFWWCTYLLQITCIPIQS